MRRLIEAQGIVGYTAIRKFIKQHRKRHEEFDKRVAKAMEGFTDYDQDLQKVGTSVPTRDIEKAESMPEWIGGGVYDPRWDDVYLDLDPENPTPEPQSTAEERAERRAIAIKAGQEACDLLNRHYRLGKYASTDSR
jgi:hypothetical protein